MMLAIPILAILCAPVIWILLGRPGYLSRPGKDRCDPDITIIIPARNEEENIGKLLESINSQSQPPFQIIVVDDGSTDSTARISSNLGAEVVEAAPLPTGWKGKPWACQQGAAVAKGRWFLFLDADLTLRGDALEAFTELTHDPNKVYSVCPYHKTIKAYEQLSAFFNVLMLAGSNAFGVGSSNGKNAALFGQSLLISRDHYQQVGGHEVVKDKILENFHLASQLEALGIPRSCRLGKNFVEMRMHPHGLQDLWLSWKKGFADGAANTDTKVLLLSSVWITGMIIAAVSAAVVFTPFSNLPFSILAATSYLIHAGFCYWAFRLAGNFSWFNALCYPISLTFYQILFFSALLNNKRKNPTSWKGRPVN